MSAVTGFKRLGIGVAALVVAVFGTLAAVSFLISADQVRDSVKAEIRAVTGLDPVLRGTVAVSLFPSGNASFYDVTLGEANDGEPPLAAEQLTARLRFLPLLIGRIEVADVALINPRIVMTEDADGRSNWAPLIASLTRALNPNASRAERLLSFSEIRIAGGTIDIRNEAQQIQERLTDVEMSLAWPAISNSFAATGRLTWRGEPLDVSVTLGDFAGALLGNKSGLKLRLAGAPLKAAFEGSVGTRPTLKIDGTLAADAVSLRRALAWMGQKPLPGGGFERFALKAQTNVAGGMIALSSVNLELDGNVTEGVLAFAVDGRKTLQGTLAADELDLTPYLSAIRLLASSEREWSRAPLDLDGLTTADLDLRLSAAKITLATAKLGRTAIAANLRGGKLTVTIGESQAFGGLIKGSIGIAKTDQGADFKSQLLFTGIDLENGIGELFGIRRIEGRGNLALTLDGSGSSVHALTRTLSGTAEMTGNKGALTGVNVEQLLRRLERRPLSAGSEVRSGRTPFEKLNVRIKVAQGNAAVEDVSLEGPAVRLALSGQASIPARDLDLKGVASLVSPPSANAESRTTFELPFVVQGGWDDPVMLPDPQSLIRRSGAAAPLLDAVRDRRAREAVRQAVERLGGRIGPGGEPIFAPIMPEQATVSPQPQ